MGSQQLYMLQIAAHMIPLNIWKMEVISSLQLDNSEIAVPFSTTRSGSKTTAYYSKSGSKLWSVTVTGTFTYGDGSRATCTKSTVSTNVYSSSWKITHSSASKSGNNASATATGTLYRNSAPIDSITKTVTLTCNVNGVLS